MCDCISSSFSPYSCITFPPSTSSFHKISFLGSIHSARKKPPNSSLKASQNSSSRSDERGFLDELKFKDKETNKTQFDLGGNGEKKAQFLRFDGGSSESEGEKGEGEEEDLVKIEESKDDDDDDEKLGELDQVKVMKRAKQLMKRSNLIAKQVISIQSALSLGFISQLWVDTNTWMVVIVEVRPNLLSGEVERFFLDDTRQVGDVVLIEDESVMDNEFKMIGLETLVGYSVVTPGQRDIGKVRGYTFNINTGAIESLELDSFGISIIPSSLVSTYALLVEDVLEVVADTVVVHEAAASRIQRLTKGFWDAQRASYSMDDLDDHSDLERRPEYRKGRQKRSHKAQRRTVEDTEEEEEENWDLPMDYL